MAGVWSDDGGLIPYNNDSIIIDIHNHKLTGLTAEERNPIILSVILTPIITLVGLTGNFINIITFHHPLMHHATYRILLALAITDILFLLHATIFFFLDYTLLTDPVYANHLSATLVPMASAYTGHVTAGTSTWLTVFVSFKRWTDIYCPLSVMTASKWTRTRINIIITIILTLTSLLYVPMAFKFDSLHHSNHTDCIIVNFNMVGMDDHVYWFYGIFLVVVFRAIPIVMLLVLNTVTVNTMRRMWVVKLRRQSTMEPTFLSIATFEQTRITIMLVILSSLTALSLTPGFIYFLYQRKEQYHSYLHHRNNIYLVANRMVMLPEFMKAAMTSFVYLAVSPKYQYMCSRIFCCSRQSFPNDGMSMRPMLKEIYEYKVRVNTHDAESETSSSRHIYELAQLQRINRFVPSISISPWQQMAHGLTDDMLKTLGRSESNLQFVRQSMHTPWWNTHSDRTSDND